MSSGKQKNAEKNKTSISITNSIGMKFMRISSGEFLMGSKQYDDEKPVHKVTISKPFYLSKYPVTQKEWTEIMGDNPSCFKGEDMPVEQVSWNDVHEFIKKMNAKEATDKYRLPSEAEWEFACRASTTTKYSFGDDESCLGEYAWYLGSMPHQVGQKNPNPWGLCDMHGNVWEWCQDRWHPNYENAPIDGNAWEDGSSSLRVDRGGCWSSLARFCRSTLRSGNSPDNRYGFNGFRLLREL